MLRDAQNGGVKGRNAQPWSEAAELLADRVLLLERELDNAVCDVHAREQRRAMLARLTQRLDILRRQEWGDAA